MGVSKCNVIMKNLNFCRFVGMKEEETDVGDLVKLVSVTNGQMGATENDDIRPRAENCIFTTVQWADCLVRCSDCSNVPVCVCVCVCACVRA